MSRLEEIEQAIENLPPEAFEQLSAWMVRRRMQDLEKRADGPITLRDHSAFLNSYSPEDEGLYDAQAR